MTTNGKCTDIAEKRINQFGDYEDPSNMSVNDWDYRWEKGQTQFHMPKVHPSLQDFITDLTDNKQNLRFFIPLCGKSLDMKWLLDQGHEVVGVDCAELGCKDFFEENNIPYETTPMCNCQGTAYKATDGRRITLYCCDFFMISRELLGTFDCVWDRGSFVAIPVDSRKQYSDILTELLTNDSKYLLDCFLVDHKHFAGPPFNCSEKNVRQYFGDKFCIKKVKTKDAMTDWQRDVWGVKSFTEEVYMLTMK